MVAAAYATNQSQIVGQCVGGAKNQRLSREPNAKEAPDHVLVSQRADNVLDAFAWHLRIDMKKPQNVGGRGAGSRVHLHGPACFGD